MKGNMVRRIESEEGFAGRRNALTLISVLLMLLGAIVLGHNTIYGSDPQLVGEAVNTPALVIPIANLILGSILLIAGIVAYRERG